MSMIAEEVGQRARRVMFPFRRQSDDDDEGSVSYYADGQHRPYLITLLMMRSSISDLCWNSARGVDAFEAI